MTKEMGTTRRCKPNSLARVVHSKNPLLVGRTVVVEDWNHDGRWNICLVGEPAFGVTPCSKRPVITCQFAARDSSLEPIETGCEVSQETDVRSVCADAA